MEMARVTETDFRVLKSVLPEVEHLGKRPRERELESKRERERGEGLFGWSEQPNQLIEFHELQINIKKHH